MFGGDGLDTLIGGTGRDSFRWEDTDGIADIVADFETGKDGDVFDLRELFKANGVPVHDLNSALLEGYIRLEDINIDGYHETLLRFDADGFGGQGAPQDLAVISDVHFTQLKDWNFAL